MRHTGTKCCRINPSVTRLLRNHQRFNRLRQIVRLFVKLPPGQSFKIRPDRVRHFQKLQITRQEFLQPFQVLLGQVADPVLDHLARGPPGHVGNVPTGNNQRRTIRFERRR